MRSSRLIETLELFKFRVTEFGAGENTLSRAEVSRDKQTHHLGDQPF
jgi:hypothetical protein